MPRAGRARAAADGDPVSAHIVLSCDGTRRGQPCGAFLHTRAWDLTVARAEATRHGWTPGPGPDLCPACVRHPELS